MSESINTKLEKKAGNLWTIVALLALAVLLTVSYKLKDLLKPGVTLSAEVDPACDLRNSTCTSDLPNGGKVTFSMTPRDLPILRPIKLDVDVEGVDASKVDVDFVGIDMEMGYNRPGLEAKGNGKFVGKTIIPVCVRSRMEWEARVLVKTDKGLLMAPFRFFTTK